MVKKFILTIDGPAASGKGALSKILASDLNLYYLETGIYYRIFAKKMLGKEIRNTEINNIIYQSSINVFEKEFSNKKKLYTTEVSNLASKLAKLKNFADVGKISFDAAENESAKNLQNLEKIPKNC